MSMSQISSAPPAYFSQEPRAATIRDDAEAVAVARDLATTFASEVAARDRERRLPWKEVDAFSRSGLWTITVPKAYGGPQVSFATLAEVIATVSAVDPSLGQIPQNHFGIIDVIEQSATEAEKRFWYGEVLRGKRFGNAFSERGTRDILEITARALPDGDRYVVNGRKYYSTGAIFAHWVPILALNEKEQAVLAFVPQGTPGLAISDDWSGFGQRTTASGTVVATDVRVASRHLIASHRAFDRPTRTGPVAQIIQAAVDAGIARGAIADTLAFVRQRSRPWPDSGQARASDDPHTIHDVGDLTIRLHAAEALLHRAGRVLDALPASLTDEDLARASVAVGEAKVLTTEIALLASSKLIELAGTQATLAEYGLDRHWRNARTHTLHDPVRWKYHLVGNYILNGIVPPRHCWN
jgi:SfnB family sulfur acquisition oxidoreductase